MCLFSRGAQAASQQQAEHASVKLAAAQRARQQRPPLPPLSQAVKDAVAAAAAIPFEAIFEPIPGVDGASSDEPASAAGGATSDRFSPYGFSRARNAPGVSRYPGWDPTYPPIKQRGWCSTYGICDFNNNQTVVNCPNNVPASKVRARGLMRLLPVTLVARARHRIVCGGAQLTVGLCFAARFRHVRDVPLLPANVVLQLRPVLQSQDPGECRLSISLQLCLLASHLRVLLRCFASLLRRLSRPSRFSRAVRPATATSFGKQCSVLVRQIASQ